MKNQQGYDIRYSKQRKRQVFKPGKNNAKNKASNRNRTDNWTLRVTCFTVELWKPISKYYKNMQESQ